MRRQLFSALSKYSYQADENFLTESLAVVLDTLLARSPGAGREILSRLIGVDIAQEIETIRVDTQVMTIEGRPDLVISAESAFIAYVEVKHDSGLHENQLEGYFRSLQREAYPCKWLVLLTRSKTAGLDTTLYPDQYRHVCWYEIHRWLSRLHPEDAVCLYLISEFTGFLRIKCMCHEQIGWEYINGLPAMMALTQMAESALAEAIPRGKCKRSAGWSWRGHMVGQTLWCGIRYENPLVYSFENNKGYRPGYERHLDLVNVHFFALSAGEQFECLVRFFKEAYEQAPAEDRGHVADMPEPADEAM